MKKEKIIYIYPVYATFVLRDIDFLTKKYNINTPIYNWNNKKITLLLFIKQALFLLKHISSSKAIIVMFGGYWSLLPALFGSILKKPVFIILGGTDCVSFPSLNYGSLRKPILKLFIKWSYMLCARLLPVSESLVLSDNSYCEETSSCKQGYKHYFPYIKTPYTVIHNGFDANFWNNTIIKKNPNSFVTVTSNITRYKIKGIDIVLKLASNFSNCSFTIIGLDKDMVKTKENNIPENVTLYGLLSPNELKDILFKNEFYLQLSISEGFPNALCEGMLCECIPVGSSVGAIPLIIGDTGLIINKYNIDFIKENIANILLLDEKNRKELGKKARNRIIEHFSISKRETLFFQLIDSI